MLGLLCGVDGKLRTELFLDNIWESEDNNVLFLGQKHEEKQRAQQDFIKTCSALHTLGVTENEMKAIFSVLAAIFHLICAGATKVPNSTRFQFKNPQSAQKAASLLGTTVEELTRHIFGTASVGLVVASQGKTSPIEEAIEKETFGLDAIEGITMGLYIELFNSIINFINRSIYTASHATKSILLIDAPGFQNPATCGRQSGATFDDFCDNYLQERLQLLFHQNNLTAPKDRYVQENINLLFDGNENENLISPVAFVNFLDKTPPSSVIRTSQTDRHEAGRRGLLWLLDEESMYAGGNDDSFVNRLFTHFGDRDHQLLLRKAPGINQFILQHLQGTNPVMYSAKGWLKQSRGNPVSKVAITILQESCNEEIGNVFVAARSLGSTFTGSIVGLDGSQSLRRASSIRRTYTNGTASMKKRSVCLQVKFIIDGLIETLRRTDLKFVHCFLPEHNLRQFAGNDSLINIKSKTADLDNSLLNVPLLRSQIRGAQILDAVQLYKQGYPTYLRLGEFRRKFRILAGENRISSPEWDERKTVEDMLNAIDLESSCYRVGLSQIFFRSGVVTQLEAQRDERLTGVITSLQSFCRGYLSRRKLQQRKLQTLAVRCIQRNVRKFMLVRDWPWWRLLVRVTPLLNVFRTEEELRNKTEELEALKAKLQKIEAERSFLKNENDSLGTKLSEMTADLAEENSTATLAGERLDAEIAERLRLETELSEHKQKNKELQQTSERLEMELLYARSDLNGMSEENEDDNDGDGVYQKRYERVLKELEFTKRRLQQQHEDDLEQLVGLKKQLEKKLADAYEEVEEQRQVVGTWKRKVQKLTGEMNDLKMLLEEQNSRNNLLEKKQRKYDSDASTLHEELKKERQAKERLYREKEALIAEKYVVDSTVSEIQLELELKEEKLAALQREFDEITCGGKTEEEVTILRKQKIDLERRLQDQEEELDELAGQVQLLEQVKLRLEMTLESIRKESKKESQTREEELEEVRCTAQRKVKALEQQLENEHEDRTTLLREKHELERRLQAAADSERNDRAGDEAVFHRLKRDLKRVKALLRDAHAQLERQKAEIPGKNVLRQLRNQVEDLEYARAIAVKTKQSLEQELSEMQSLLDEAHKQKSDAEDKATALLREKSDIQTQLEENEEELAEVLKKYKAAVQQMSIDQMSLQEQVALVSELEIERNHLKEQLADITSRLESAETMGGASSNLLYKRSELKIKDLESKLELEQTTRSRLEVQITRLKETVERLQSDLTSSRIKEQQAQDQVRKLQRQMRELKEELNKSLAKESEVIIKKKELEKRCETLEAECSTSRTDLRLALKRIEDLQSVIQGDLEDSVSNQSESEEESSGGSFQSSMIMEKDGSPKAQVRRSSTNHSIASGSIEKDSSYA